MQAKQIVFVHGYLRVVIVCTIFESVIDTYFLSLSLSLSFSLFLSLSLSLSLSDNNIVW